MTCARSVFLTAVLFSLIADHGAAQVLPPALEQYQAEIGYAHLWFKRDMQHFGIQEFSWQDDAIVLAYGLTDWLTISGEGLVWSRGEAEKYPGRDYRVYHLGGGMTVRSAGVRSFRLLLTVSYAEAFWFDRSESMYHKKTTSLVGAIGIERAFDVYGQRLCLRGGPTLASDAYVEFPWGANDGTKWTSVNDLGFAIGGDFLTLGRIHFLAWILYADHFQPRLAVAYRR